MTSTSEVKAPRLSARHWFRNQLSNIAPFLTLLFLVVFFCSPVPPSCRFGNLQNILQQVSITGIIAVGLTFVILTAEIDLSVASVANATGIVVAFFTLQDASVNIANIPLAGGLRDNTGDSRPAWRSAASPPSA